MSSIRLTPETHRLTNLPGQRHPLHCQRCSGRFERKQLAHWQEHDHNDQPEPKVLLLCTKCSDEVIEPHPRLYKRHDSNWPFPGLMEICVECKHRITGNCELAQINGGPGVNVTIPPPVQGFMDGRDSKGRRTGGRFALYIEPANGCTGREV